MSARHSWSEIRDVETLTGLLGEPTPLVRDKARSALTDVDVAWLRGLTVLRRRDRVGRGRRRRLAQG